ncbi:hypothetical protein, partial [Salmonella sp. s51228]|uniref:hypothetical protein n=1 Tax=Salmonella sp. s51228 TaxID=3159652 RepID=UPI00398157A0
HFGNNILKDPYGICIDNESNIYVTDSEMHSLIKFSNLGEMVKMVGKIGTRSGEFTYPRGLTSDMHSNIYVVESIVNGRVQVFDCNLNFDDNAKFRQELIFEFQDNTETDP